MKVQLLKYTKKKCFLKIEVENTWYGYYNDTEDQLTCYYPQICYFHKTPPLNGGNTGLGRLYHHHHLHYVTSIRGCSHMTSAQNGGVQTPRPPSSAKVRNLPTSPPPLSETIKKPAYPPSTLVWNQILIYNCFKKKMHFYRRGMHTKNIYTYGK